MDVSVIRHDDVYPREGQPFAMFTGTYKIQVTRTMPLDMISVETEKEIRQRIISEVKQKVEEDL
jgi:hypothetical protein